MDDSLGSFAPRLHGPVVRLLWLALNPQAGFSRLPHGWAQNRFALPVSIVCGAREAEIRLALENLFWGNAEDLSVWSRVSIEASESAFERAAMLADLEEIETFVAGYRNGRQESGQLALL